MIGIVAVIFIFKANSRVIQKKRFQKTTACMHAWVQVYTDHNEPKRKDKTECSESAIQSLHLFLAEDRKYKHNLL